VRVGVAQLLLLLLFACESRPDVEHVRPADDPVDPPRNALSSDELSTTTAQFLVRKGLEARYAEDAPAVLRELEGRLVRGGRRVLAFYLAELAYRAARKAGEGPPTLDLSCAAYAFAYLFDPGLGPKPIDFRLAAEYYNRSLAHVIRFVHGRRLLRGGPVRLKSVSGDVELRVGTKELGWDPEAYDRFLVAYDYKVRGFKSFAGSVGIGVPVIAVHERPPPDGSEPPLLDVRISYAATVLLRFEGSIRDGGRRTAQAEIYDPLRRSAVRIEDEDVPLTVDLTTPLAFTLASLPERDTIRVEWDAATGLTLFQPYQPGRIPVVFVHGLKSSPQTFAILLNELLADRDLRRKYQFWFFGYPSGNPILYSAAVLRRQLLRAARAHGDDPAFRRMVLCGHSMGGLVVRLMLHGSGDRLWRHLCSVPLDELHVPGEDGEIVRRTFFFEPLPFVRRAIFMATPHRGSALADTGLAKLASSALGMPPYLRHVTRTVFAEFDRRGIPRPDVRWDGIGNLSPGHPLIREISTWSFPPGLKVHTIIGNKDGEEPGGSDGYVEYESSHLDNVESERIVHSYHSVQKNAAAIREVRRILALND